MCMHACICADVCQCAPVCVCVPMCAHVHACECAGVLLMCVCVCVYLTHGWKEESLQQNHFWILQLRLLAEGEQERAIWLTWVPNTLHICLLICVLFGKRLKTYLISYNSWGILRGAQHALTDEFPLGVISIESTLALMLIFNRCFKIRKGAIQNSKCNIYP